MRILFITANRIGDAVLTTGLLRHLTETYPDAKLTIACGPAPADLFRAVPGLEKLILFQKQKGKKHWLELWKTCVPTRWDIVVDLRNSLISRLLFAKKKYHAWGRLTSWHKVVGHARAMKLDPPPAPRIWTDKAAEEKADALMPKGEKILALGPSANWPPKQWPAYRFADLAQRLTAADGPLAGAKILLVAAPHERKQLEPLFFSLPPSQIIDAIGQDLLTVAACLKKADLFIGNDSGLMHIAAAMGAPTLALFGPGWEKIYGPWGKRTAVVRSPFGTRELLARQAYVGADEPNLMEDLTVGAAHEAALALLNSVEETR